MNSQVDCPIKGCKGTLRLSRQFNYSITPIENARYNEKTFDPSVVLFIKHAE